VRKGHAVYRLGTCEQGAFEADLIDLAFTVFQAGMMRGRA
jgi:hypothetical protein